MTIEEQKRLAEELLFAEEKKPGFAKRLYFGHFDAKQVFPYPRVSSEEKQQTDRFVDKIKKFAQEKIDPDAIDRNAEIPDSVIQGLSELGVLGMTVPKEYGGLGMSQYAYCRVIETLSHRCASTALFVSVHQSIGLKALLLFGTDEQKKKWLPPLARGECYAAFALTEPNAGSDAAGIESRAVYDPERNIYRINGQKQWITNGSIAKVLTVMAKTEDDKVTAFLVNPEMPGFEVTAHALEKVGLRGTKTAKLAFHDLEVAADNILGTKGKGLKICLTVLDFGRTTFGAICSGAAKFLVKRAIEHAKTRYQFKRPLASFGLVKKKIALMSAYAYAIEATTYMTAGMIDRGVEDIMLESAMLKVFASEALWSIIYETMQIFGGRSFFTDEPYERMMRDGRLNQIGEGANEVMRAFIGVVGMRDVGVQLKNNTVFQTVSELLARLQLPQVPGSLKNESKQLGKAVRRFGFAVVRLLAKYREDVIERQLALDRMATSAIALYTATSVLSKLDADQATGHDLAIGTLYIQEAMKTVDRALGSLFKNNDSAIESVSDEITGLS